MGVHEERQEGDGMGVDEGMTIEDADDPVVSPVVGRTPDLEAIKERLAQDYAYVGKDDHELDDIAALVAEVERLRATLALRPEPPPRCTCGFSVAKECPVHSPRHEPRAQEPEDCINCGAVWDRTSTQHWLGGDNVGPFCKQCYDLAVCPTSAPRADVEQGTFWRHRATGRMWQIWEKSKGPRGFKMRLVPSNEFQWFTADEFRERFEPWYYAAEGARMESKSHDAERRHGELKAKILRAVDTAYQKALEADGDWQQKKPDVLKHLDADLDKLLRPLFT
jgi:hypothetical protein